MIAADRSQKRPPFEFSTADEKLLDEVQHAAFLFMWNAADPATGMVVDRSSKSIVSVGGVGFQLSAIAVGVERGWITRAEGEARTLLILKTLSADAGNRKAGLFYHYLDGKTGSASVAGYEHTVSTIDSALLFAGMITSSSYFKGDVANIADALIADANWKFFVSGNEVKPSERGFVSLGWKPKDPGETSGEGSLLPYYWIDNGDEHRLVTFLGVAAPKPEHRVSPETYYKLRRKLGTYADLGPIVWFPWSGALFATFFANCWIDYAAIGVDDPMSMGVERRARVDWWENSRRTVMMHRIKAIENPEKLAGFGKNQWGLNASDAASGYAVPGLFPKTIDMPGAIVDVDYAPQAPADDWGDGTVAPYTVGCAVMFEPEHALTALRAYRSLKNEDGKPLVWRDPIEGGYGFLDAFNAGTGWVGGDYVAIDQGPLVLSIENARTGLVWRLFHEHPAVKGGMSRLGLRLTK